jgi:hypothetical protein
MTSGWINHPRGLSSPHPLRRNRFDHVSPPAFHERALSRLSWHPQLRSACPLAVRTGVRRHIGARSADRKQEGGPHNLGQFARPAAPGLFGCVRSASISLRHEIPPERSLASTIDGSSLLPKAARIALGEVLPVHSRHSYRRRSFVVKRRKTCGSIRRFRNIEPWSTHLVNHLADRFAGYSGNRAHRCYESLSRLFFKRTTIARCLFPQVLLDVVRKLADRQTRHQSSPDCNAINVCNDIKVINAQTH